MWLADVTTRTSTVPNHSPHQHTGKMSISWFLRHLNKQSLVKHLLLWNNDLCVACKKKKKKRIRGYFWMDRQPWPLTLLYLPKKNPHLLPLLAYSKTIAIQMLHIQETCSPLSKLLALWPHFLSCVKTYAPRWTDLTHISSLSQYRVTVTPVHWPLFISA